MLNLSKASYNLLGQPMFKVLHRVQELERQGRDIVHFEIGDPDFKTPDNIVEAGCNALKNGLTHYTSSMGLFEFRDRLRDVTTSSRGFTPDLRQILITPGANIIIYYAVRCLVDPGDDILVPDPGFPTYLSVASFCGVNCLGVPLKEENYFRMNPVDVRNLITRKTRLIIINSPNNPCGSVMTRQELDELYDIAEEYDCYLMCDEVYSRMMYNPRNRFYSPSSRDGCKTRTILTNGFSKAFSMTGWRLGCVIGPEAAIEKMSLLLQTTASCVQPFIQIAGIEAVTGSQDEVRKMMKEYDARRKLLVEGLNNLNGVTCIEPEGAFYAFPNISGTGYSDHEFADIMLEEAGVAVLPGSNFGNFGKGYVRLCYATSQKYIVEGIERMRRVLE